MLENEKLWRAPRFKVSSASKKNLMEVMEVAKISFESYIEDESLTLLVPALSGENADWRVYNIDSDDEQRNLRVYSVRRIKRPKLIKHGGRVTETLYQRIVLNIALGENCPITIKQVFTDEDVSQQVVPMPQQGIRIAAMA